jgi:hypothetical protein
MEASFRNQAGSSPMRQAPHPSSIFCSLLAPWDFWSGQLQCTEALREKDGRFSLATSEVTSMQIPVSNSWTLCFSFFFFFPFRTFLYAKGWRKGRTVEAAPISFFHATYIWQVSLQPHLWEWDGSNVSFPLLSQPEVLDLMLLCLMGPTQEPGSRNHLLNFPVISPKNTRSKSSLPLVVPPYED